MTDRNEIGMELDSYAKMLVRKLLVRKRLKWDCHQREDAAQDLLLAGWQVWKETEDMGLAKNRMRDRRKNVIRDYFSKSRQPKPESALPPVTDEEGREMRLCESRSSARGSPDEELVVQEFLAKLPERTRQVCNLRMAGYDTQEMAQQLGCSLRTVEREINSLKEYYYEFNG